LRLTLLALTAAVTAVLCGGCATQMGTRQSVAQDLDRILRGDQRSEADRARDVYRHPKETLLFFGLRPNMRVVEIWPEAGWYTEVIAPLLAEHGKYYAAQQPSDPRSSFIATMLERYRAKLAARPDLYRTVEITSFSCTSGESAPAGSADMVVTFRNVHNWMAQDCAPAAFAAMYRALKPGGVLGVVEHRGSRGQPQDPHARSGYVSEEYAIGLIEAAGFKLVARAEINANPRDTKDYEQGVWTLPPTYRLGERDHDKYAAIGESDRFTLKFVKPK